MNEYLAAMEGYWDQRFKKEDLIWGEAPSNSARNALELFKRKGVRTLLVPGCGYGRNTRLFADTGLKVTGTEISGVAIKLAKDFDTHSRFIKRSLLDFDDIKETFDALYCFNVLHLFRRTERKLLIDKCAAVLKKTGIMYFVVFSEKEASFGKGQEVEDNTFESKPGRPVHYFSESDLLDHFKGFDLLESGMIEDPENHGEEGRHTHLLRYIACSK